MKKILNLLFPIGLAVALLLSGCGSKEPDATGDAQNTTPATESSVQEPEAQVSSSVNTSIKKSTIHTANVTEKFTSIETENGSPIATISLYDDDSCTFEYKGLTLAGYHDDFNFFNFVGVDPMTGYYTSAGFSFYLDRYPNHEFQLTDLYDYIPHSYYGEKGSFAPILLKGEYGDFGFVYDIADYFNSCAHLEEGTSAYLYKADSESYGIPFNDLTTLTDELVLNITLDNAYVYLEDLKLSFDGITDNGIYVYTYSSENPNIQDYSSYYDLDGYNDDYYSWDSTGEDGGYYDEYDDYGDISDEEYQRRLATLKDTYSDYDCYDGEGLFLGYSILINENNNSIILYDIFSDSYFGGGDFTDQTDGTYNYSISSSYGYQDASFEIDKSRKTVNAFFKTR